MSDTMTIEIPLIRKNHCCRDCKKYQPRKKWCVKWGKATKDVALECKPKPEWEKDQ